MKVIFYHYCDQKMAEKLEEIGCYKDKEDGQRTWTWPDVLEKFISRWDDKFLAMKDKGEWFVYVTHKKTFGCY